jgi:hypothetical protein
MKLAVGKRSAQPKVPAQQQTIERLRVMARNRWQPEHHLCVMSMALASEEAMRATSPQCPRPVGSASRRQW